jgi:hypothetical protein
MIYNQNFLIIIFCVLFFKMESTIPNNQAFFDVFNLIA